jgi:hypothetical protein
MDIPIRTSLHMAKPHGSLTRVYHGPLTEGKHFHLYAEMWKIISHTTVQI